MIKVSYHNSRDVVRRTVCDVQCTTYSVRRIIKRMSYKYINFNPVISSEQ